MMRWKSLILSAMAILSTAGVAQSQSYSLKVEDTPNRGPFVQLPVLMSIIDNQTGGLVQNLDSLHGQLLHLMVLDKNYLNLKDIYPVRRPDGKWQTSLALGPGSYSVYGEFAPRGQKPVIVRSQTNLGSMGMQSHMRLRWTPNQGPVSSGDVTGVLELPSAGLVAGQAGGLAVHLSDSGPQKSAPTIESTSQAYGRVYLFSEDGQSVVASEVGGDPDSLANVAKGILTFSVTVPRPGPYRAFVQFKRGTSRTLLFTVAAH